jgi:hypothetical protein
MPRNYKQGYFVPTNPDKCINAGNITYRSSWEKYFFEYLDKNPKVIKWGSEVLQIPYESSVKGRLARYFPDVLMTYVDKSGETRTVVIEIKPAHETVKPKKGKRQKQSTHDQQTLTYITNLQKWEAAQKYAAERGWGFRILTENDIFR